MHPQPITVPRPRLATLLVLLTLSACRHPHSSRLSDIHSVSLQPVGAFPAQTIDFLQADLSRFLHKPIVLLPPTDIPSRFRDDTKGPRYSADSLVQFLSGNIADPHDIVIGLTTKDIFTTVCDSSDAIKPPLNKYAVWGIFGLGSCPGHSSIVSTQRLQTSNEKLFLHRLRTVVLHELGHNLGLPHCPNPRCIMNDANETIATIDNSGDNFCPSCQKKLN